MTEMKLFDSERKVMECLWDQGDLSAKELAEQLELSVGWSKPTTYTVIRKCVAKGAILRIEPGFLCRAPVSYTHLLSSLLKTQRGRGRFYGFPSRQ